MGYNWGDLIGVATRAVIDLLGTIKKAQTVMILRIILVAIIFIGLTSYVDDSQNIQIHLIYTGTNNSGFDQITIQHNKVIVAKIMTDKDCYAYIPQSLIKDSADYDLYLTTIGVNGTYLATIDCKLTGLIEIILPKTYKMRFGKAICPKCGKTNKVIKAIYSEAPIVVRKVVKGDTIYSPIYKSRYYMNTDVTNNLDPKWYCERDNLLY
jgi:hypothetical protein